VTDSTASLSVEEAARWGIVIVPLEVIVGGERHREGRDLSAAELATALSHGVRVTTSQPAPAAFADAYAQAAASGAREIVSVHLSGELSGTVRAAQLAALAAPVPVHVVDSRSVVMGLGFAVLSAAQLARGGRALDDPSPGIPLPPEPGDASGAARRLLRDVMTRVVHGGPHGVAADEPRVAGAAVAERARAVASSANAWFLVDSLDHLRRGGRLNATAAAFGTVFGLRPILALRGGRIEVAEKVRTRRGARDRLEAIVVADVRRRGPSRVAVHHLGQPEVADAVARQIESRLGDSAPHVDVREVSAVIGAHVGPGLLAVVVADA
jgi:fatty acid-binding protein DegV